MVLSLPLCHILTGSLTHSQQIHSHTQSFLYTQTTNTHSPSHIQPQSLMCIHYFTRARTHTHTHRAMLGSCSQPPILGLQAWFGPQPPLRISPFGPVPLCETRWGPVHSLGVDWPCISLSLNQPQGWPRREKAGQKPAARHSGQNERESGGSPRPAVIPSPGSQSLPFFSGSTQA